MNEVAQLSQNYLVGSDSNTVPAGYKQTEVGVIPEDWSLVTLGSIFNFKNGLNKEKHYFGYGTPIVNYMDVYESGGIHCSSVKGLVCVTPVEKKNYSAKRGDVFFTRTSETVEEIGLASVLLDDLRNAVFSGFLLRARQLKETFVPLFMKYCFRHELARKQIQSTASYTTRALTNGNLLSNVYVTVPSKKEQIAIANALSDVDALISEQEKLIAKKQAIKTATMQQLLTGRTRLPAFAHHPDGSPKGYKSSELGEIPEDWEVVELGEVSKVQGGFAFKSEKFQKQGLKIIRISNIQSGIIDNESLVFYSKKEVIPKQFQVKRGDTLIAMSGATTGKAGVYYDSETAYINQRVGKFVIYHEHTCKEFIQHTVMSNSYQKLLHSQLEQGAQPNISSLQLERFLVRLPSAKKEQTAIATILSDMDAEIEALEQRLSKTRQIKQGMMQELLTGKTRLLQPLNKESQYGCPTAKL